MKLGISVVESLGWRTVLALWRLEAERRQLDPAFISMSPARGPASWLHRHTGRFFWLTEAVRGRQAAKAARALGCERLLLATTHNAPLLPMRGLQYVLYGDSAPHQLRELGQNAGLTALDEVMYRRLARLPAKFAMTSRWSADGLQRYGVPPSRVELVPFATVPELWTRTREREARLRRAIFLGGDFKRKGGPLVRRLAADYPEVQFVYVTSEKFDPLPNEQVHRGLSPLSAELLELVGSCDLLVLPTNADSSSIAAIECAAAGLPAIATPVGGVPEVVLDGITGTIVPPGDYPSLNEAFAAYLRDPKRLQAHGQAAREKAVRDHDLRVHFDRLLALFSG